MPKYPELVPALVTLRSQINLAHPGRSKISDGWKGDAAHAARKSWHNPDQNNWVHAIDITHDPAHGVDIDKLTDILASRPDFRLLEMIANGLYWHYLTPRWVPYRGTNAHRKHCHISARPGILTAIDPRPWDLRP